MQKNGADVVLNYRDEDWVDRVKELTDGRGADVIYDPVGGDTFDLSTKCIAFEGRLLIIGFASGRIPSAQMNRVLVKNFSLVGLHWGLYFEKDPQVLREAQAGHLTAVRGRSDRAGGLSDLSAGGRRARARRAWQPKNHR